ncbi:hypothetical protein CWT12_00960 [Actinomyces sp. 432]|nr:hypothetical protein CWT12_00960 [Actinomyces sp. 432]
MDADGVQGFIDALQSWVDDAEVERSDLYNLSSSWEEEPVEGVEEKLSVTTPYALGYTRAGSGDAFAAFGGRPASMADALGSLQQLVNDLQTRLDEAIAMNDSGITFGSTDGRVCYYLPDGVEDTTANVKAYNSGSLGDGAKDAEALQQAMGSKDGTAEDGRTVEEILDEMAEHQDVPTYGAAVVQAFGGVDGYLDNLLELQWDYNSVDKDGVLHVDRDGLDEAVDVLGRVLASATRSGKVPEGYDSWSDAMYQAVTVKGHRGRMSALNALMAVDGAVYDTDTLVDLADRMEDLPFDGSAASATPDSLQGWYDDDYGVLYDEGKALRDYSMDPLYGVTMAMGNNPEAAFKYLNPDGQMSGGQWVPGSSPRSGGSC